MTKKILKTFLIILCITVQPNIISLASIQTANDTSKDQQQSTNSDSTNNATGNIPTNNNQKLFKLNATKVQLSLEQLTDVGLDLKNVLTSSRHLYDEVMVRPVTIITEPEMIADAIINIPVATVPTGPPRPPRKERVDILMSQIKPVITLLKQNADEFMSDSQITNFPEDMQPIEVGFSASQ